MSSLSIAILIPVVIFIFLALVFAYSSRVKKVGPNEVLVISGRGSGRRDISGVEANTASSPAARTFIWPVLGRWMTSRWNS